MRTGSGAATRSGRSRLKAADDVRRSSLGVGELKLMDCRQLWDIGSELVTEDPHIIMGEVQ